MSDAEHIEPDIGDCGVFDVVPADGPATSRNRCSNLTIRVIFSTPGLVALVILYSVLGAIIFPLLEAKHGHGHQASPSGLTMSISKSREDCLRELWTITERLNVLYERNWTMLVHEQLRRFEGTIVAATKGRQLLDPTAAIADDSGGPGWSFKEALLYSVTVITTIGHGNMTPRTAEGKLVTMVYALFGVPLMLMCLSSLGGLLAESLQCVYCRVCRRRSRRNSPSQRRDNKFALKNGCAVPSSPTTPKPGNVMKGESQFCEETDCDGRSCKYDYMLVSGGGIGVEGDSGQNNSDMPYHQTGTTEKPLGEEGNLYTGSPKHANTVTFQTPYPANYTTYTMLQPSQSLGHPSGGGYHPLQTTYHRPHLFVDQSGSPTKKFFLAEMPIDYTQLSGSQQQQQLQDAVTNVVLPTQANLTRPSMGNGSLMSSVILLNPKSPHHIVPMPNSTILGKSKFMPKPLPQEINLLIAESSEMDCQQQQQEQHSYQQQQKAQQQLLNSMNYTPGTMEDDEDEDSRSYPIHGTPSRIPLIKRSGNNSLKVSFSDTCKKSDDCDTMHSDRHAYGKSLNRNGIFERNCDSVEEDGDGDGFYDRDEPLTQVPMLLIFAILFCYISVGTIIFVVWEDWSIIDGAYFCFVTLSTIGFGDLVPSRTFRGPEFQLFACFLYLLVGLVLVAMTFTVVENQLMWKCRRVRLKLAKP